MSVFTTVYRWRSSWIHSADIRKADKARIKHVSV